MVTQLDPLGGRNALQSVPRNSAYSSRTGSRRCQVKPMGTS